MKTVTTYEENGRVLGTYTYSAEQPLEDHLDGHRWIEGTVPPDHQIIDGQAVPLPPNPSTPLVAYSFNHDKQEWEPDLVHCTIISQREREQRFAALDRVNPIWYASLTPEQQQELQQYRRDLIDVVKQPGYPTAINWPQKPGYL